MQEHVVLAYVLAGQNQEMAVDVYIYVDMQLVVPRSHGAAGVRPWVVSTHPVLTALMLKTSWWTRR